MGDVSSGRVTRQVVLSSDEWQHGDANVPQRNQLEEKVPPGDVGFNGTRDPV